MFEAYAYLWGLVALLGLMVATWVISLFKRNVSIVDCVWGPAFLCAGFTYTIALDGTGTRSGLVLALVAIWSVRLGAYLTWRNWGELEDRRYLEIRERNQPNFATKSLYLVFGLQAVLA